MSARAQSFEPIAGADARVLILGSMPGQASLLAGRYYAHPRNAFWPILGGLLGFDADTPYAARCAALLGARIALWDVLHSCVRVGSLDSAIEAPRPNEFARFFSRHRAIERIVFNGLTAEKLFRRQVLPMLRAPAFDLRRAPSTSPAHAGLPLTQKRSAWAEALAWPATT